jgi:phage tail sheath protein FI
MPLVGGFNGLDITEKEPFSERSSNSPLASTDDETTSYAYNSIKVAMDSVSDPEVVETNLITIPGIQNAKLTNKLIEVCEQRADALAVIDIEGDFKSVWESTAEVKPNVTTAISSLKARTLNSSYGCTFFPAVLAKDTSANALVSLPSSVVALGTIGSSAAFSEIWFAPAGFNRGGLSNGAAGFPVVGVKTKLTSQERDRLYEVNINPIASFPAEGIVVFGQKTLQATPSSLDRINVRRLMIYLKKEISKMANTILFDPNSQITWARFTGRAVPFLQSVQSRFGLTDFKVVLDETTTTPELVDRNIVYAKIFLKPARTIEYIALDFILTNTGASFDD